MSNFYDNLSPEDIQILDSLSKLLIELRESRYALLAHYGATSEEDILAGIRNGKIDEHPGYEAYLGAKGIQATRETVRQRLRDYMLEK